MELARHILRGNSAGIGFRLRENDLVHRVFFIVLAHLKVVVFDSVLDILFKDENQEKVSDFHLFNSHGRNCVIFIIAANCDPVYIIFNMGGKK